MKANRSKQIAIVGVAAQAELGAAQNAEQRRKEWLTSPYILRGSAYSLGLAYPPPGIVPPGEAAIRALVAHHFALFGATSGERAHLFWMTRPLLMADLGPIEGVREVAPNLVMDGSEVLRGAARDSSGLLFAYDTRLGQLGPYGYNTAKGKLNIRKSPLKNEGLAGLSISEDKSTLAGIGAESGRLLFLDLKTGKSVVKPCLAESGEAYSRVLCPGRDGLFYTSGKFGELVRVSCQGETERLGALLPSKRGKAYLARIASMTQARNGWFWGGTEDGYLFCFDPDTGRIRHHGRGNDIPDLFCIVEGLDGLIYGITGRGKDISHLVSFDPAAMAWTDIGLLHAYGLHPWTLYQAGAMVVGHEGQLYIGEDDNFGHLFIYHPPAGKAGA